MRFDLTEEQQMIVDTTRTFTERELMPYEEQVEREADLDDKLRITTQVLDFDAKRLHFNHEMFNLATNVRLATCEQMLVHVDSKAAKSAPIPDSVAVALKAIKQSHSKMQIPPEIGRTMKIKHKN